MTNFRLVLRGELLRPIPLENQPQSNGIQPNYSVESDPALTLFVVEDDISPLSIDDYHLLKAIKSPFDRFRVFSDPQLLDWGTNLNVNDQVYISLPTPNASQTTWSTGIVRYRGPVKTLPGINFGVEIVVSIMCLPKEHII